MARRTTNVFFDSELKCGYAYASDGTKFLFDMEDAELVRSRGWHLSKRGYIAGKEKSCERPLHKLMIKADKCFDIDHINRIKTDCRRENLRVCMHQENLFNQSMRSTNTSGYMGVSRMKSTGKYESYVHLDGHKHYLGTYDTPEEAAYIRDAAAKKLFGDYCYLNFPEVGHEQKDKAS